MNDEHAAALLADKFGPSSGNEASTADSKFAPLSNVQPAAAPSSTTSANMTLYAATNGAYAGMPPLPHANLPSQQYQHTTSAVRSGNTAHLAAARAYEVGGGGGGGTSVHPSRAPQPDDDPGMQQAIQAYAKLEGPNLCYYMRTLSVTLGRTATSGSSDTVDISLGPSKAISRQHARIFYNFMHHGFELQVFGKNGCFVNENYVEKGVTVSLRHKSIVHIGEIEFTFLLPTAALEGGAEYTMNSAQGAVAGLYDPMDVPMGGPQHYPPDTITPQRLNIYRLPSPQKPYGPGIGVSGSPGMLVAPASAPATGPPNRGPESPQFAQGPAYQTSTTRAGGGNPSSNTGSCSELPPSIGYPVAPGKSGEVRILPSTEKPPMLDPRSTHTKPPFSYASLIAQAINSTEAKKITLNGIYQYIMEHYPYYKHAQNGWQNSIRHNLSLNKAFVKVQRATNEPGKGAYWTIDEAHKDQFSNGVYKRTRRSNKSKSVSGPGAAKSTKVAATQSTSGKSKGGEKGGDDSAVSRPAASVNKRQSPQCNENDPVRKARRLSGNGRSRDPSQGQGSGADDNGADNVSSYMASDESGTSRSVSPSKSRR